jgi:hypothetical protein
VVAHEMNKDHKPLLETGQTGLFDFVGSGGSQGHRRLWQGRSSPGQVAYDLEAEQDPRQIKELWRQLEDLIEEK